MINKSREMIAKIRNKMIKRYLKIILTHQTNKMKRISNRQITKIQIKIKIMKKKIIIQSKMRKKIKMIIQNLKNKKKSEMMISKKKEKKRRKNLKKLEKKGAKGKRGNQNSHYLVYKMVKWIYIMD